MHCRERRLKVLGHWQVVETNHGDVFRHLQAAGLALNDRAIGQDVVTANDRRRAIGSRQQPLGNLAARRDVIDRFLHHLVGQGDTMVL